MEQQNKKTLSASSIKSIDTCTWSYYCQYENKIPQTNNEGALRGTIVHLIFELLLNPRHRKHYDAVMEANDIKGSAAIRKLLIKHLKKVKILKPDNYEMCNAMILVGLKTDFFCIGGKLGEPEFRFELENENPKYVIRGYIDKLVFYQNGLVKIVDYKSSKSKFSGDDLTANIQAMAYSLVAYKMFKATDATAEFIFLRFPRQPVQAVHPTKEQLQGFEHYLAYMYALINNFDEKKAQGGMAAYNKKNKWLCKAGAWQCPYMNPFKYYALVDDNEKICRTSLNKDELVAETGQKLVVKRYNGCPAYQKSQASDEL